MAFCTGATREVQGDERRKISGERRQSFFPSGKAIGYAEIRTGTIPAR